MEYVGLMGSVETESGANKGNQQEKLVIERPGDEVGYIYYYDIYFESFVYEH